MVYRNNQRQLKLNENIAKLVKRVASGDLIAAEQLYESYASAMFHLSFRMTLDKMLSEDILQECFIKSFLKIKSLKNPNQYGGWLKRMVINATIDKIKKRKQWELLDSNIDIPIETDNSEFEIKGINLQILNEAIAELPEKSRVVLCLYLLEDKTHREISELVGISISTSKSQYQYALKLLRVKLNVRVKH